ncbi:unnamed protein product [Prorocentrum cordatum]|uniref:JmjC domain-containing protein n=1 Tax=Prorocentrum cordatum TaxID=2364126 RepID=A0ABN9RC23_9DINO|nr:unnamed protein product [Polarella glacialis]
MIRIPIIRIKEESQTTQIRLHHARRRGWLEMRWPRAPAAATAAAAAALWGEPASGASIWGVGKPQGHVEVRDVLPTPAEFFTEYVRPKDGPFAGVGKPVLFRGAAKRMPAYEKWTDEYLREKHGSVRMDQVETEKAETRTKYPHEDWTLEKFIDNYNTSEIYSTAQTPEGLSDDVYLLPCVNCGGFHSKMATTVTWFSSGSTRSVIHSDAQQNLHCMFDGRKDWILWSPTSKINSPRMGWVHAEEESKTNPAFKDAYGQYVGHIDVDDVDLKKYPGWGKLSWWNLTLQKGDCAYIPPRWFHFVEAPAQRSLSVHVWFDVGKSFKSDGCETLRQRGLNLSDYLIRLSDCQWGFGEKTRKPTKCKVKKPLSKSDEL